MEVHPLPDLDPLAAAAGLMADHGTVLLHTQRNWHGSGCSWLLLDPVGELELRAGRLQSCGMLKDLRQPGRTIGRQLEHLRGHFDGDSADAIPLLAGFLGYEAAPELCPPHPRPAPFSAPDAWFGLYDAALCFGDGRPPRLHVRDLGPGRPGRINEVRERLQTAAQSPAAPDGQTAAPQPLPQDWHRDAVLRIQDHLRQGDSYQVNLTGLISAETTVRPFNHFLKHAAQNPVAFASAIRVGTTTITSHSPERLLRIQGDAARTAPIKGTLAGAADAARRLRASAKDQAEHLMVVDLCRNDLGRRSTTGSVRVEGLMESLQVQGIEHLVSRIRGQVRPGARGALLDSMFPGASITGAPKRRTMQIIRAVELAARGPYTGSIGYLCPNGDLDFNIAIRTAVWEDDRVHFGCGGGIVIDSDPAAEYEEARLKARSFFTSLAPESRV